MEKIILFYIDQQQFAINIEVVEKVVAMAEVSPLPQAPAPIAGTINFKGAIVPVLNMRKLFQLKNRTFRIDDQLIIACTNQLKVALWVDRATDIIAYDNDTLNPPRNVFINNSEIEGLLLLDNNRILISNPNKFLTIEEISKLAPLLSKKEKINYIKPKTLIRQSLLPTNK